MKPGCPFWMVLLISFVVLAAIQTHAPVKSIQQPKNEQPIKVSYCELKKDPVAYNHKLVEITAFVSHGFEDFTLFDPTCSGYFDVWLEYGGTSVSGTMYCCGVTSARSRPEKLVVENIPIDLVADERFKEFDDLIRRGPDSIVRATVMGRFFAGEYIEAPRRSFYGGYGHAGCCSLLAIQQVVSVERVP